MKAGRKRGWTEEHVEAIRKMAAAGESRRDIARALGLSLAQVRNIGADRRISFHGNPGRPSAKTNWPAAYELAQQGKSVTEAADILGLHWSTCIHIGKRMGFVWPRATASRPRPAYRRPMRAEKIESNQRVKRMMELVDRLYVKRSAA